MESFFNKFKVEGVDMVHDLDVYPWPFPDNHFDVVYARDVIEHVKDIFQAMNEINRICKEEARVELIVPYWHSSEAFYPNHNYYFNTDALKLFTQKDRDYDNYYGFDMNNITLIPSRIGWLIPPIPLPKSLFENVIDLRHLVSYLLGEIIIKINFNLIVRKKIKHFF